MGNFAVELATTFWPENNSNMYLYHTTTFDVFHCRLGLADISLPNHRFTYIKGAFHIGTKLIYILL